MSFLKVDGELGIAMLPPLLFIEQIHVVAGIILKLVCLAAVQDLVVAVQAAFSAPFMAASSI